MPDERAAERKFRILENKLCRKICADLETRAGLLVFAYWGYNRKKSIDTGTAILALSNAGDDSMIIIGVRRNEIH